MRNLIIIGARGFGREVSDIAKHCIGYGSDFLIKGFLDDNINVLEGHNHYPPILASVEDYNIQPNDIFICALGSIKWSVHYTSIISSKGGEFINLIHKNSVIRNNVKLGKGIIIGQGSLISTDIKIGDYSQIMSYSILGHDVVIGSYCRIGDYVFIGGNTIVENNVFIAVRSTLLARLTISQNSIIGVGSVVIRNVKEGTSVFGNPAKKIEF